MMWLDIMVTVWFALVVFFMGEFLDVSHGRPGDADHQ